MFVKVRVIVVALSVASLFYAQQVESKKLLALAAAAAIIRGGPIIPIPVRYPVHIPQPKVLKVPVHQAVHVKIPLYHHSHAMKNAIHLHSDHSDFGDLRGFGGDHAFEFEGFHFGYGGHDTGGHHGWHQVPL